VPPATLDIAVGVVFCVLGGILVLRRERRSLGILFVAVGAAWLLGSAAPAAVFLYRGPLIHLLVSYPEGRPRARFERVVVVVGYVDAVELFGGSQWITVILALVVAGCVTAGERRASGAKRRAKLTSAIVGVSLMAILGVGAAARLAGVVVDPQLLVVYQTALLLSGVALFADAWWGRWNRFAITGLVIDLGRAEDSGTVRDKIALALGDPQLEIGFVGPGDTVVDEAGRPAELSRPGPGRARTTLRIDGRAIADVVLESGALDDPALLESVTAITRLAFNNARLQSQLLDLLVQVDTSRRRILQITDRERHDLAAELRAGAVARLDRVEEQLSDTDGRLTALVQQSRSSLENFARGVHPRALAEGGLAVACGELGGSAAVPVHLDIPDLGLPTDTELTLYFVCAEALTNVGKYAHASSVWIGLETSAAAVRLTISDDGVGGATQGDAGSGQGTGLRGLADRLAVIGETLVVTSPAGTGTTVIAAVPQPPKVSDGQGRTPCVNQLVVAVCGVRVAGASPVRVQGLTV
jgi:signal transduction histidine kinase